MTITIVNIVIVMIVIVIADRQVVASLMHLADVLALGCYIMILWYGIVYVLNI